VLRFYFGSQSPEREKQAERAYRGLVEQLRSSWTAARLREKGEVVAKRAGDDPLDRVLSNAELLEQLRGVADELDFRLENYVEAAGESADALDEGFLLATKAYAMTTSLFWRQAALRRLVGA
jgi:hypothetical protein